MKIDNESKEMLKYISEDFVLLATSSTVAYHIESSDQLSKESFKLYCSKHYGDVVGKIPDKDGNESEVRLSAGEIWWAWNDPLRRVVRRIVMEPTSKPETDDNPEEFNRWHVLKETMVDPDHSATHDDIGILLRHLLYISDNDMVGVAFFLNWLAQLYQTPEVKIPSAVLLYSKFGGVGKSILHRLLKRIFGKPLVGSCTGAAINKGFDDVVEHKRLIFINEMARSDKVDGYERFKNMVSEEDVSFEGKGRAAKDVRNFAHYIITTNNCDALPLMDKDRRVLVLRCLAQPKADGYYEELRQWIDGPGAPAFAGVLANWVFPKDWNPHAPVPQTEATVQMQQESRGTLTMLIEELIEERRAPFDKDIGRILDLNLQIETLYGSTLKGVKINTRTLPQVLERLGAVQLPRIHYTTADGKPTMSRCWCWRNQETWANATGAECAAGMGLAT